MFPLTIQWSLKQILGPHTLLIRKHIVQSSQRHAITLHCNPAKVKVLLILSFNSSRIFLLKKIPHTHAYLNQSQKNVVLFLLCKISPLFFYDMWLILLLCDTAHCSFSMQRCSVSVFLAKKSVSIKNPLLNLIIIYSAKHKAEDLTENLRLVSVFSLLLIKKIHVPSFFLLLVYHFNKQWRGKKTMLMSSPQCNICTHYYPSGLKNPKWSELSH